MINSSNTNGIKMAVLIPTLNEEITIGLVIDEFKEFFPIENMYIIDGNSEDNTLNIVKQKGVNLIVQNGKGKGQAIIQALNHLSQEYDYVSIIDGDMTYLPRELELFVTEIKDEPSDLLLGDRLRWDRDEGAITRINLIGNWIFSFLIKLLHGGPITDSQTGYRVLSKELIKFISGKLSSRSFEIESEIGIYAARGNFKIKSIPITYQNRPMGSETKLNPLKTGWKILKKILILRFRKI